MSAAANVVPPEYPRPKSEASLAGQLIEPLVERPDRLVDEIEMLGEEEAGRLRPDGSEVSAGVRYLHSSRTIHQLVGDRNRAVGIYLAVASLLFTATGAVLNAKPVAELPIPIEQIQIWSFPTTLGVLTILGLFTGFLLIRTRVGLIYEVAKMNALLGLPVGRVRRVNVFSLFFLMHALVALATGGTTVLFVLYLLRWYQPESRPWAVPLASGAIITVSLIGVYVGTVLHTTTETKLKRTATDHSKTR